MLDTRETVRTFPNLGQPLFAAREQTRTNQKKARLKDFRRVATRYDKLTANFASAIALAAVAAWC